MRQRHIEVKLLWVQKAVRRRWLRVIKFPGTKNPTDILIESKSINGIRRLAGIGVSIRWEKLPDASVAHKSCAWRPNPTGQAVERGDGSFRFNWVGKFPGLPRS